MDTRQVYKGFPIEASPEELTDGWSESYIIKVDYGDRIEDRRFSSDRRFRSRDEAIAGCLLAAQRHVDRSIQKSGRSTDCKDAAPFGHLSATWSEEDPLTGDGALHCTNDNQRPRLDEIDGETD